MAGCGGRTYDDGSNVDFGSVAGPSMYGTPVASPYGYLGESPATVMGGDPAAYTVVDVPIQEEMFPGEEVEGMGIAGMPEVSETLEGYPAEMLPQLSSKKGFIPVSSHEYGEIHIPFEIEFQPTALHEASQEHIMWAVKETFSSPFSSPGDEQLGDSAILGGIELFDLEHDFGDKLAVQVSIKEQGATSVDVDKPDSAEGERLFGSMFLGSHKLVPVHGIVGKGDKKAIPVLDQPDGVQQSFLEQVNSKVLEGQPMWSKSRLLGEGVTVNTARPGTLLVANANPVLRHIDEEYADAHGQGILAPAGEDHTIVMQELFANHTEMIMRESARNIKLGDVRNNLRVFVMRNIPSEGPLSSDIWTNPKRIFDHIQPTLGDEAIKAAKERVLNKTYSFSGILALTYLPLTPIKVPPQRVGSMVGEYST